MTADFDNHPAMGRRQAIATILAQSKALTDADLAEIERTESAAFAALPAGSFASPRLVATRMEQTSRLMKSLGSDGVIHCMPWWADRPTDTPIPDPR
jgi:hypothetical protein